MQVNIILELITNDPNNIGLFVAHNIIVVIEYAKPV